MKKLNYKFSDKTMKNLKLKNLQHHKECRSFIVGGIGKTHLDLLRNPISRKWKCHPDCTLDKELK